MPTFKKGFTMIETLVAIAILVIAVIGPMSLLSKAIADSSYARNQVVATYLAQEGIESVINKRNIIAASNKTLFPGDEQNEVEAGAAYLEGQNWLTGPEGYDGLGPCVGDRSCVVESLDVLDQVHSCSPPGCKPLKFDPESKLYQYETGEDTIFVRSVKITPIMVAADADGGGQPEYNEARVEVTVNWHNKNDERSITLATYISKMGINTGIN